MTTNASQLITLIRSLRTTIAGCEMDCRIHSVRRLGDSGHAVISIDALNANSKRVWTSGPMAILLDTVDGTRPMFKGRTSASALRTRALSFVLGRSRMQDLCYWVDSSAHFWCADNARRLYAG